MHAIYGLVETFNIGSVQVHRQHPQFLQPVQWQQTSIVLFSCVKVVSLPWMPVIDNIPTFLFKKKAIFTAQTSLNYSQIHHHPCILFLEPSQLLLLTESIKANVHLW